MVSRLQKVVCEFFGTFAALAADALGVHPPPLCQPIRGSAAALWHELPLRGTQEPTVVVACLTLA